MSGSPTYRALVVTASNRAAAGVYADKGGPLLVEGLAALGLAVDGPRVVPDGDPVEAALRDAVAASYDVVVTTGGTGISPTDRTPEATRRVLDYEVPGIAEAVRAEGLAKVPTAALSRGLAGVAGPTLIVNLPGSTGGVRDGLAVLGRLLVHAVEQLRGGDHPRPADSPDPAGPAHPADTSRSTDTGGPTDTDGPADTGRPTDPTGPTAPTGPAGSAR
ncbi:MogA/MoaB family molybdenum cofactor biosynthesis protein [Streptomyces sp. NPDC097640]|uniref:MogA/MoaB family molybdenum cofactor biosynthesis protein n=1 Tax=Streptomyces sp. NPDC097640 TaxID=3157229 RepID=UPI00332E81F8